MQTPEALLERAKPSFGRVKELFELRKVNKWKHTEIARLWPAENASNWQRPQVPIGLATTEAQLVQKEEQEEGKESKRHFKIDAISHDNPVEDFKKMISDRHRDLVVPAFKQLMALIPKYARVSHPNSLQLALSCFQELRQAAIQEDEVYLFNVYLQELKCLRILAPEDFPAGLWDLLVQTNCTLISKDENVTSLISSGHAQGFFETV